MGKILSIRVLFFGLFAVIFLSALSYVYFINLAVLKTAESNKNFAALDRAEKEVQQMEVSYIDKLDKLSIVYAKSLGFIEAEPSGYIYIQKTVAQTNDYGQHLR